MKKRHLIILAFCCLAFALNAQEVNFRAPQRPHLFGLHAGADYGAVYGLSYAYRLPGEKARLLGLEFSIPLGKNALDDWKLSLNAQGELLRLGSFSLILKPGLLLRRYESAAARIYNIGVTAQTAFGVYRPKWFAAAAAGYDYAAASNLRHFEWQEQYPGIRDGWYGATGGNFQFGVKTGVNFQSFAIALNAGKVYGQNFRDHPTLPFYFDVSVSFAPKEISRKNQKSGRRPG